MAKRFIDVFFSLIALFISLPLFILCIIIVAFSSPGPVFYSHMRVGRGGKPFKCLKFRTMYCDADERFKNILDNDPSLKQEWVMYYKLKQDPRITPFGRWLRKTSLDEIPQLINVLKGEMSLVGPRPLTQSEANFYLQDKAEKILSIRPGLTSLWIVTGRNQFTMEERVKLEEFYVDHRNGLLDLQLIGKTFIHIIFPKGAY